MVQKDYDHVAFIIFGEVNYELRTHCATRFAEAFRQRDAQFDYDRFVNSAVEGANGVENYV